MSPSPSILYVPIEIRAKLTKSKCAICNAKGTGCDAQIRFSRIGMWMSMHTACAERIGWGEHKSPSTSPIQAGIASLASSFLGVVLGESAIGHGPSAGFAKALGALRDAKRAQDDADPAAPKAKVVDADFTVIDESGHPVTE